MCGWTLDYGDVPTWIAAVATVGAFIFAGLAFWSQSRQIRRQQKQITEQQELSRTQGRVLELQAAELRASLDERRRSQATFIMVDSGESRGMPPDIPPTMALYVRNLSGLPIFEVRPLWLLNGSEIRPDVSIKPEHGDPLRVIPRLGPELPLRPHVVSLGSPGITWYIPTDQGWEPDAAEVEFRDAAGAWWRSTPAGDLREIPGPMRSAPSRSGPSG